MSAKRYYWLKLYVDFFTQKMIKRLRQMPGGDTYVLIYLKMLLLSLSSDGRLYYENLLEDFTSELSLDLDESVDNVGVTVDFLIKAGILVEITPSEYELLPVKDMTGTETDSARRKRLSRMGGQIPASAGQCPGEIEIEVEKEKSRPRAEAEADAPPPPPGRAVDYFRKRIDKNPTPSSMEQLIELERVLGPDVCCRAVDEAVDAGKKSWNYVHAILVSKNNKGIRSLEDWERNEAAWRSDKKGQATEPSAVDVGDLDLLLQSGVTPEPRE